MKVVIEAFDKETELLVLEVEVKSSHVEAVAQVLGLSDDDLQFLLGGAGGFDVSTDQAKAIEQIINEKFFSPRYDYQLGTS